MKHILIDTHTLIWLADGNNIGPDTIRLVENVDTVFVSALSILELRIKAVTGKLPEAEAIIDSVKTMGFQLMDFAANHSHGYKIFNPTNKDPFDNALISLALHESLPLATADKAILALKISGLMTINVKK